METEKEDAHAAATSVATASNPAYRSRSKAIPPSGSAIIAHGEGRPLTERQMGILEARGINVELAVRLGWRSSMQKGSGEPIEIPYFRNGAEVNCKTRTIEGEKRFHQVEGGEKCFYNVDAIKDLGDETLIITEGEMDCVIALQCGYIAVSVPDGAPKEAIGDRESRKYDYLRDIPQSVKKIILATDADNPGINLMNDLALRLGRHRCQWLQYPKGCKDLNDTFRAWKERGVAETIARARFLQVDGLYHLSELPPLPELPALSVDIEGLEPHLRLRCGDFSVMTGIPSHGKSTFANHLAFNMAKHHGWHVCFASFEQPPQTEHCKALSTLFNEKPYYKQTPEEKANAVKWIDSHFSFIVPSDDSTEWFDMAWLRDRMAAAVTRNNAKLIIIDPWNELDHVYDQREMTLTQYVGMAIKDLKRFAKKFMVHVMVVAHPAKMRKGNDGKYPIPTAYDISDSSHWYNKPEQVIIVHRQDNGNSLIRIAKSRYHYALGKPGDVELRFDDYFNKFVSPETYG
ncbi:MAG TPA: bifunctional DNA primase/helicase [Gemmataceae bacterium]|nr:bifunctional DNA primase/helicase [Gemmataceae bacterium]